MGTSLVANCLFCQVIESVSVKSYINRIELWEELHVLYFWKYDNVYHLICHFPGCSLKFISSALFQENVILENKLSNYVRRIMFHLFVRIIHSSFLYTIYRSPIITQSNLKHGVFTSTPPPSGQPSHSSLG
jgi:hypothetical protein